MLMNYPLYNEIRGLFLPLGHSTYTLCLKEVFWTGQAKSILHMLCFKVYKY